MSSETTRKGDIAEQKIILNLLEKGFDVFKPINNDSFVDLVFMRDEKLESIQIKYATAVENKVLVRLYSGSTVVENRIIYSSTSLDWMAVYCPNTDQIYYLPRNLWLGKQNLSLNLGNIRPQKNSHLANDYLTV